MMTRGTPPSLPLTVNERIVGILKKESNKVSISVSFKKRLQIVLDGIAGKSKYESSKELNMTWFTVDKWRKRWKEHSERLHIMEREGVSGSGEPAKNHELLWEIKTILSNKPGQGARGRISMAQKEQIVALACEDPESHNIPMSNWTYAMLAHVAMAKGIVEKISSRHVGNILKKRN